MKNFDPKNLIIVGLILVVVILLVSDRENVQARFRSTDNNGDMIAVTGEYGNGTTVLWVIDTNSKQLAAYRSINCSTIELVGARRIEHDLKLMTYRDRTAEGMSPPELRRKYLNYRKDKVDSSPHAGAAPKKPAETKEK